MTKANKLNKLRRMLATNATPPIRVVLYEDATPNDWHTVTERVIIAADLMTKNEVEQLLKNLYEDETKKN